MLNTNIPQLTRVRFVYYDNDGNEYYVIERDMNTVPNVGEEIFLDTGDFGIDPDGWIKWIRQQRDKELVKNVPPFINIHPPIIKYKGVISYDQVNQLLANHTQEEIDNFISRLIQGT